MELYSREMCWDCSSELWPFSAVSHLDRSWLNRPLSEGEVYEAISQMGPYKALGPDGFAPCIFQKFWHVMGGKVTDVVHGMFATGKLTQGINEAIICLIPTGETPETLSQFRPISLCNVLSKVVTKILANRLKPIMPKLTGKYQSSFILGRSTIENIVVAQEALHTLQKRKGFNGGFILKVDLEKAYDRIDWSFLRKVLDYTGFNVGLKELIMECISTTRLQVGWNGQVTEPFMPTRGLRQRDPLSPYLCVMYGSAWPKHYQGSGG